MNEVFYLFQKYHGIHFGHQVRNQHYHVGTLVLPSIYLIQLIKKFMIGIMHVPGLSVMSCDLDKRGQQHYGIMVFFRYILISTVHSKKSE